MESRVEMNTMRLLDLLAEADVKATFFVVGWVAERHGEMVQRMVREGHTVACHSYMHRPVFRMTPEEFRDDTRRAKEILEDLTASPVTGYRAPSYSITKRSLWAFRILEELGFRFDSSVFPVYHDRYGIPDAPRFEYRHPDSQLVEYPLSTVRFLGYNLPVGGGGYFRLFPYGLTRWLLGRINHKEKQPFVFYLHPWEIDPGQPRVNGAKWSSRFRHYNNLHSTLERFERLLKEFRFRPMVPTSVG